MKKPKTFSRVMHRHYCRNAILERLLEMNWLTVEISKRWNKKISEQQAKKQAK